jgi:hypothetical protein
MLLKTIGLSPESSVSIAAVRPSKCTFSDAFSTIEVGIAPNSPRIKNSILFDRLTKICFAAKSLQLLHGSNLFEGLRKPLDLPVLYGVLIPSDTGFLKKTSKQNPFVNRFQQADEVEPLSIQSWQLRLKRC